jgi:CrcB protein
MPMLKIYLAVMFGGAIGTALRMALAAWCAAKYGEAFPIGTMAANVIGSFAIGLAAGLLDPQGLARQVVMVGILGGFTTFSSFSLATLNLLAAGEWWRAGANIVLSVGLGLLAVWIGQLAVAAFPSR